jgi:hypothetical protein
MHSFIRDAERATGRRRGRCSYEGCERDAVVGGHVHARGFGAVIAPICRECNLPGNLSRRQGGGSRLRAGIAVTRAEVTEGMLTGDRRYASRGGISPRRGRVSRLWGDARRARTRRVRAVSQTSSVASRCDGGGDQAIVQRVRRRYFQSTGVAHRVFAVLSTRKFRIDVVDQAFVRRVRRRYFRSTGVAHRVFAVLSTRKFRIDVVARADVSHRIRRSSPSGDGHRIRIGRHRIRIGFRVANHLSIPSIHVQHSTWKNM